MNHAARDLLGRLEARQHATREALCGYPLAELLETARLGAGSAGEHAVQAEALIACVIASWRSDLEDQLAQFPPPSTRGLAEVEGRLRAALEALRGLEEVLRDGAPVTAAGSARVPARLA